MQRRAAEESLTDHGKDNSNGRAHVGDAIRHKPGILGFLRQIGFMGATTRAEDVCRRYLPRGRKQGRYWTAGDTSGAKGRSLFVRLAPPGIPGKWTDAATNEHGDLLDLIRLHTSGASLRHAMDEARAFLVLPPSVPATGGDNAGGYDREEAARRLWRRCRPIDGTHAEAYLHARAIGHCRFPALRFHPDLIYRGDDGIHRMPALVAAVTGDDGAIEGVQRTWLDPKRSAKANFVRPRKALGRVHGHRDRPRGAGVARVIVPHSPRHIHAVGSGSAGGIRDRGSLAALPAPAPLAHPPGAGIPAIVAPLRARYPKSHHDGAYRLGGYQHCIGETHAELHQHRNVLTDRNGLRTGRSVLRHPWLTCPPKPGPGGMLVLGRWRGGQDATEATYRGTDHQQAA